MSIGPAAQLRHELRTPLNHIIGYAEMLLEELEGGDRPDLMAGLGALRADARELLGLLNGVLAQGGTGPPDLAAARGTLAPLLDRLRSATTLLRRDAAGIGGGSLVPDLDRIQAATERLAALLDHGGGPPAGARPGAEGRRPSP